MTLLKWKPSYSLGIPSVDQEHRELISLINAVYSHLDSNSNADEIEACLEDIYAGIASHFALEERHMREADYEEYRAHKNEHEELLDQIRDLMDDFEGDPEAARATLESRLSDWFGLHFSTFDARLHLKLGSHHH